MRLINYIVIPEEVVLYILRHIRKEYSTHLLLYHYNSFQSVRRVLYVINCVNWPRSRLRCGACVVCECDKEHQQGQHCTGTIHCCKANSLKTFFAKCVKINIHKVHIIFRTQSLKSNCVPLSNTKLNIISFYKLILRIEIHVHYST